MIELGTWHSFDDIYEIPVDLSGLYIISNKQTKKEYVGKSINLRSRLYEHKAAASSSMAVHTALKKYGSNSFEWMIYLTDQDESLLLKLETDLIRDRATKAPKGYNLTDGGEGVSGFKFSEASKLKLSNARKNKKRSPVSALTRSRISAALKGRVQSDEVKLKRSISTLGRKHVPHSDETKRKIGLKSLGRTHSAESKAKISKALTGRLSPKTSKPVILKVGKVSKTFGSAVALAAYLQESPGNVYDWMRGKIDFPLYKWTETEDGELVRNFSKVRFNAGVDPRDYISYAQP